MTEPFQELRTSLAGRYDVERELGEGGMATVYVADDVRHGRKVAIKLMRSEIAATLGTERFLAEIKLTAKLQHPHILGLIDSGVIGNEESGRQPFYVMPLIVGETLRDRLRRSAPLPIAEAVPLLVEICDALACAHNHSIVHRDIKPENILLSQGHALVADFGVAKALHHSVDGANITLTGVSVGTPAYMSPEQALADPNIDHRADLYALGVVAYEMVAGKTPFTGSTVAAMVKAALTQDAAPLISVAPNCPPRLSSLVGSLLEKDPGQRPQSTIDVRDTLRSIVALTSTETAGSAAPRGSRRRLLIAGGLALAATLAAIVVWHPWKVGDPPPAATAISRAPRSIAVLPFRNINNDSTADYFSDGMAEELISALGRLKRLRVASRTSTFAMKGHVGSLADVAKQLGVDAVVESSVRHDADSVLINSSLVDVRNDSTLWAGEYKGGLRNVLYVQDSVARSIANALNVVLGPEAGATLASPRAADPRAYDAYVRGRAFLGQRNPVAMASAIRSFESAIKADPSFAPAYAGLADAYSLVAPFGGRPPKDVLPLARAAAERALTLDSTLAEAHTSLGIVAMFYDWNWSDAGKHLERGVALNPSSAEAHLFYAWYLLFRDRMNDALAEVTKAHELDQLSPVITTRHGNVLQFLGRDADAIPVYRRALALDSTFFNARVELAYSLLRTGQRAEAGRVVPRTTFHLSSGEGGYPAWILAQLGDTASARAQLREFETAMKLGYVSADAVAGVYAAVGDSARALDMLERALNEQTFTLVFLPHYPMFNAFHNNPRYRKIVERIGVIAPKQ
jgi:TolB-like protein/tetratricopeptide (TPR) repeat protein/tRNA A-37 threonylcarbamoyl transferase component Bud32